MTSTARIPLPVTLEQAGQSVVVFYINTNVAKTQTSGENFALYNGFDLNESLGVRIDLYAQTAKRYRGILFNYTDALNFYLLRAAFGNFQISTIPELRFMLFSLDWHAWACLLCVDAGSTLQS